MNGKNYINNLVVGSLIAYAGWSVYTTFAMFTPTRELNPMTKKTHDKIVEREICLGQSILRLGAAIENEDITRPELEKIYADEIFWLTSVFDD